MSEAVKVIVRCRPLNKKETELNSKTVVQINNSIGHCDLISLNTDKVKTFVFDGSYGPESNTEQIYNEIVFPLVESVIEGYNATVFAYGQTGCGKSFTMQGIQNSPTQRGIIPRSFEHVFESISITENYKYLVHASYLEIYNEEIRDLLGKDVKKKLELKESNETGLYVNELSLHPIHNFEECEKLMEKGWKNRSVGSTLMNTDSSRSHSIFTLYVERMNNIDKNDGIQIIKSRANSKTGESSIRRGKLNLVDLAGSERHSKTGTTGDRFKEATKINLSLSALGNVISALVDGKQKHIPYRDSKLTRLLQDSLGGNTKTLMVACLSPSEFNYDETLSTLRYANRAKSIQNKPKINEDPKDALLREYQEEISKLRTLLDKTSILDKTSENQFIGNEESIIKIKEDYDRKMEELLNKYKEEQENHEKLKNDLTSLKQSFEEQLKQKDTEKTDGELSSDKNFELMKNSLKEGEKIIKQRLRDLNNQMVGGENVNDTFLQNKRAKRKELAEAKNNAIKNALKQVDNEDNLLIKAYGDITEELRSKNLLLKKAKKRLTSLEQDVKDLQSEFEVERTDYLETIRKQDQQNKLSKKIIEKLHQIIQKGTNYSNLDKIKQECIWNEDEKTWYLPDIIYYRTKLPPADFKKTSCYEDELFDENLNDEQYNQNLIENYDDFSKFSKDSLFQKLEKNAKENIAANYFKPKRQEQLLNHVQTFLNNSDENNNKLISSSCLSNEDQKFKKNNEIFGRQDRAQSLFHSPSKNQNKIKDDLTGSLSAFESQRSIIKLNHKRD